MGVARSAVNSASALLTTANSNLALAKIGGNSAAISTAQAAVSTATEHLDDAKGDLQQLQDKAASLPLKRNHTKAKVRPRTAQRRGNFAAFV